MFHLGAGNLTPSKSIFDKWLIKMKYFLFPDSFTIAHSYQLPQAFVIGQDENSEYKHTRGEE